MNKETQALRPTPPRRKPRRRRRPRGIDWAAAKAWIIRWGKR